MLYASVDHHGDPELSSATLFQLPSLTSLPTDKMSDVYKKNKLNSLAVVRVCVRGISVRDGGSALEASV